MTGAPARDVEIAAPDGVKLRATCHAAARTGPAVLLLHMCNADRESWKPLGPQLAAAGIHALALDYRGYGDSGGERFKDDPPKQQKVVTQKWPGDADAELAWIRAQPGVDKGPAMQAAHVARTSRASGLRDNGPWSSTWTSAA